MQQAHMFTPAGLATCSFPAADQLIGIGQLRWGRQEELCTPAYWASQAWMLETEEPDHYRLGDSLAEETLACLLGGHGIPAEVGVAAYHRLRAVLRDDPEALMDAVVVEQFLREPFSVGGRSVRYRFAAQKARYVSGSMRALAEVDENTNDRSLRDALLALPGIGLKTASWIVRNWRQSDEVSILDIHILRAGAILGIFKDEWRVERDYLKLEEAYLEFARKIGCRASILDSVMWVSMRQIPASLLKPMLESGRKPSPPPKKVPTTKQEQMLTLV